MSSKVKVAGNEGDLPSRGQSRFYNVVMTPIIFVSFLFSLAFVELRYSLMRNHLHSDPPNRSRLPAWLHRIIYREQPYQYVRVNRDASGAASPAPPPGIEVSGSSGRWYYHSKQKKLLRMEVTDAFEIRNTVVVALGLIGAGTVWCCWRLGLWAYVRLLDMIS